MLWSEIRTVYPDQWLIVEALDAHTTPDGQRQLDRLAVVETCPDGITAMQRYRRLHQQYPRREFYFVHTSREELDIRERDMVRSSEEYLAARAARGDRARFEKALAQVADVEPEEHDRL